MIVEFPDNPTWIITTILPFLQVCDVSLDGRYLVVYAGDVVAESHTFYMDIGKSGAITRDNPIVNLFPEPGRHVFLGNDDNLFYFRTNFEAPNFKIISFDVEKNEWSNMIEENPSAVIVWAKIVAGDKLVLCYNEHLDTRLEIHKLDDSGELIKTIAFEDNISPYDHYGRRDLPDLFLRVESYLNPGILYRLYFEDDSVESEVYDKIEIPYYDPTSFTSELVFYSNDDGTNIPMTLVYKNTTELDGSAPCILYGYGGFGKTSLPYFDVRTSYLLKILMEW
ncbi:Prolyl endopeptidase [Orchesella cincta]|uniref:Prolyl endopeptidase n=1 Tax=Orchesella cincta TaxID=48709 RepID=A0A1D2M0N9_ORCCI|nr:Prolyl endopeptidase [Orchesella cincta]